MTRTAAVTGATGFLGTHLCARLTDEGWTVRALRRPTSDTTALDGRSIEWFVGDLGNEETLRALVDGVDAVFHLAGIGLWSGDDETVWRVNATGTHTLLEACRDASVGRVLFTSTAGTRRVDGRARTDGSTQTDTSTRTDGSTRIDTSAQAVGTPRADSDGSDVSASPTGGVRPDRKQRGEDEERSEPASGSVPEARVSRSPRRLYGVATEVDHAEPIGAYQASKRRAEQLVDAYAAAGGDAVTVHPTSVFGPGDETFTAPLLAMATRPAFLAYLPGGASVVGVSDVIDGILAAYERGGSGEHYLLGGENLAYGEAVQRIAAVVDGSPARIRVPASAIHAAGPVAGLLGRVTDLRVFPFDSEMARLSTRRLYYSSQKAAEELGYRYRPIEDHVPEAMAWFERRA